ncbi:MAG: calcium/sodium antiporter [Paracoccaceae bacterium]
MLNWAFSGVGLVILLLAGDMLVKGAVNLSLRLGIPAMIISLTIVAFGTSAPELLISLNATLSGASGIAVGNVVGSNIANILLVLGVPAMLFALDTSKCDTRASYFFMLFVTAVVFGLAVTGGVGGWPGGGRLGFLGYYMWVNLTDAQGHRSEGELDSGDSASELEEADPDLATWKIALFLILGLAGLPLGADLLVDNASEIAYRFGISDAVIGLTLIAIGTSLPELATTVASAFRKQADVALGNVIGSNIFNLLGIIGVTAMVDYVAVAPMFLRFDLWVMLASSLVLIPFVLYKVHLTRLWGVALTALYLSYVHFILA